MVLWLACGSEMVSWCVCVVVRWYCGAHMVVRWFHVKTCGADECTMTGPDKSVCGRFCPKMELIIHSWVIPVLTAEEVLKMISNGI
jgi:hypothetical protein